MELVSVSLKVRGPGGDCPASIIRRDHKPSSHALYPVKITSDGLGPFKQLL